MKRRRGVKMAFLLVGLCAGLAGVAGGYERLQPILKGFGSGLPLPIVESPGALPVGAFDPVVMMAGLPGAAGLEGTKARKTAPELVIFGPGGNGPAIDPGLLRGAPGAPAEAPQRPPIKSTSVVVVRETESVKDR